MKIEIKGEAWKDRHNVNEAVKRIMYMCIPAIFGLVMPGWIAITYLFLILIGIYAYMITRSYDKYITQNDN